MAGQLTAPCAAWQGTSRGGADIKKIVQRLSLWGVNMLFVVGGNGSLLCLSWLCKPHTALVIGLRDGLISG
jgi:6-phosphofructokinase